ncbi:alkaline phosphatase family protein [Pseudohalioglobus sediminis]|uniref:Alkaline phosphatase family protein n=1 Tax=Pseudohalioglobus sediminis TaxID=2606449 RepID=A0A5B0WQX4_9GAMM|nr:alkaline phosphatase family protein [Pseudohalioglobus sediminis]KAA1188838.1 alkaline phosphatase family protein [Pseudohalioglobus sediminis]
MAHQKVTNKMKLLVIGIDGGTTKILEGMPMPFTKKLLSEGKQQRMNEDLLSRGWAEILTGHHASTTSAFYMMPFCDHSYRFSISYNQKDLSTKRGVVPIWKLLNERGYSVGIMNVPTTAPAPTVNGFAVAGGGGGLKASGGISESMVYPKKIAKLLNERGYVADIRLPGNCATVSEFATKITKAQSCQKDSYLDLCKQDQPEFGFFCFRMTTELQYLAKSEIDRYVLGSREGTSSFDERRNLAPTLASLIEHYKHMDNCIRDLFEALDPDHFMILGDHSTASFLHEVNLDIWLQQNDFLELMGTWEDAIDDYSYKLARLGNRWMARLGLSKPWLSHRRPITRFSRRRTRAFSTFYDTGNFAGIYINDSDRFRGPVHGVTAMEELVADLCSKFNETPEAKQYGMVATPYRAKFAEEKYCQYMPDIRIEKPDTMYFSGRRPSFITCNPHYGELSEKLEGVRYPHTGLKGSDPVFCISPGLSHLVDVESVSDLTLAYRICDRLFD